MRTLAPCLQTRAAAAADGGDRWGRCRGPRRRQTAPSTTNRRRRRRPPSCSRKRWRSESRRWCTPALASAKARGSSTGRCTGWGLGWGDERASTPHPAAAAAGTDGAAAADVAAQPAWTLRVRFPDTAAGGRTISAAPASPPHAEDLGAASQPPLLHHPGGGRTPPTSRRARAP